MYISFTVKVTVYPARAPSPRAQRACALRALGLLLADGTPTGGRGEDFLSRQPNFFTETAVTPADLIALLVRLRVNLGLASSALTQSDSLAIITTNSLKSES